MVIKRLTPKHRNGSRCRLMLRRATTVVMPLIALFWTVGAAFPQTTNGVADLPAVLPDVVYPDVVYPDAVYPDVVYPDVVYPDVVYPDVVYPDVVYPDTAYPDTPHPDTRRSKGDHRSMPLSAMLSEADVKRYRQIFKIQEHGQWQRADRVIAKLDDKILLGHVLFQRYMHPTKYRSRYAELSRWLKKYPDHPNARRIYRLAVRRKPKSARSPRRPRVPPIPAIQDNSWEPNSHYVSSKRRNAKQRREARRLIRLVRIYARSGRITKARRVVDRKRTRALLDRIELDTARAFVGEAYFFRGTAARAYAQSGPAAERSGTQVPLAHWTAGLAAYLLGKYPTAAYHFESMAKIEKLSPWTKSAAAFWAARANLIAQRPNRVTPWLERASSYPRTFYGILASRVLGVDLKFDWEVPRLTADGIETIKRRRGGRRALALLQIGEPQLAERELVALTRATDYALGRALFALAEAAGLPGLALRTSAMLNGDGKAPRHAAKYPVPHWEPPEGFVVDRAVLYAFMRQESQFNTKAKSRAGARGLMQLMPATASFMGKQRFRGPRRARLYDPELNISLGQKYLRHLIDHDTVNGDMLMVAAAYNGGPGNLAKWRKRAARRKYLDPLMFIESIPTRETRNFIERVLANLWIYRHRLGQNAPSLDALAAGETPYYKALDVVLPTPVANHVRH